MDVLKIKSPSEIKDLSLEELDELNENIRKFLVESIAKTGGHLGSSLGAVDLITAIHYVFDSPKDKIIFDVGHQAYAHKILTGRAKDFSTLRKYQGLSGFLKMEESDHDVWESGHASNSISAGIGYAMQRDLDNDDNHVVVVIGDGSMTNGMSLEALNHLIEINKKLIIIINDNEMSISPNIGFIDKMFKGLEINSSYDNTKQVIKKGVDKIDKTHNLLNFLRSFKNKLKTEINQTKGFFNLLGFKYLGPVDGHNMKDLIKTLETSKSFNTPLIIHVKTIKGKGYLPAETNMWHSVSKFDIVTGEEIKSGKISNSKIISNTLQSLMEEDENIVIITPAMIQGGELKEIQNKFPDRITDVGIAEEHATSLAAGLALAGKKPFLSIYSTFLQRSYDQVFQDIVRQKCNVVVGVDRAGLVGADGETHHGIYDISYLSHMPGATIVQGKDGNEIKSLLKYAFDYNGPIFLRYSKNVLHDISILDGDIKKIDNQKWPWIQKGNKLTIITYGDNADLLTREYSNNEDIGIINARFIKPLDEILLKEISENKILIVEEVARIGGLGNLILDFYNKEKLSTNVSIMAIDDKFVQHGSVEKLKKEQNIDLESIKNTVEEIING